MSLAASHAGYCGGLPVIRRGGVVSAKDMAMGGGIAGK